MEELKTRAFASRTSGFLCAFLLACLVVGLDLADRMQGVRAFVPGEPAPVSVRMPMTGYMRLSFAVPVRVEYELDPYILRVGEVVPDRAAEQYKLLQSTLERRAELRIHRSVGIFLVTFLLGFLLSEALRRSWPGNRRYLRTEVSIYLVLAVLVGIARVLFSLTALPVFVLPAAAVPIVISYYRGRRLGVYVSLVMSFILSMMLDFDAVAFVVFLVQGLSVVPFLKQSRKFGRLVTASLVSTVAGFVTVFGLSLALSGSREMHHVLDWKNSVLLATVVGGLLAGVVGWILAMAMRPVLGIVSQSRLNDLQELSHPLLKRLASQAPGTWEHSRAIANLAEEAASKIDADALLVRVGSYFHDMGKAVNPNLFVENQAVGEDGKPINAHDGLAPERSASLIMDHVLQGVQILRNNGVPESVVQFAYMHHGSSVMEFFWNKYLEQCKKEGVEKPELGKAAFTYPGIPPQAPETGIMMLADAVEAASRTVTEPTHDKFSQMVNRLVFGKLAEGQLDECGLTVKDLKVVTQSFVETLFFSHHKRVKYQWQEREDAERKKQQEQEQELEVGKEPEAPLAPAPVEAAPVDVTAEPVVDRSLPPPETDVPSEQTTSPGAPGPEPAPQAEPAAADRPPDRVRTVEPSEGRTTQPQIAMPIEPRQNRPVTNTLPGVGSVPPDEE